MIILLVIKLNKLYYIASSIKYIIKICITPAKKNLTKSSETYVSSRNLVILEGSNSCKNLNVDHNLSLQNLKLSRKQTFIANLELLKQRLVKLRRYFPIRINFPKLNNN